MYVESPKIALDGVRRVLVPTGTITIAVWAEPERVLWADLPRRIRARYETTAAPARSSRLGTLSLLTELLASADFEIERVEEHNVDVVESNTCDGVASWARTLGFAATLSDANADAWQRNLADEVALVVNGPPFRLGGVTRIITARVSG